MFWNTGVYQEVVPNSRIVSTISFVDETVKALSGSKAPVPGRWPDAITVTTEFRESNGKTKVTVKEVGMPLLVMIPTRVACDHQFDKMAGLLGGTPRSLQTPPNTLREAAQNNSLYTRQLHGLLLRYFR